MFVPKWEKFWEKCEILFYSPPGGFARIFLRVNKIRLLRIYNILAHFLPFNDHCSSEKKQSIVFAGISLLFGMAIILAIAELVILNWPISIKSVLWCLNLPGSGGGNIARTEWQVSLPLFGHQKR
jgi:hypothetical protein